MTSKFHIATAIAVLVFVPGFSYGAPFKFRIQLADAPMSVGPGVGGDPVLVDTSGGSRGLTAARSTKFVEVVKPHELDHFGEQKKERKEESFLKRILRKIAHYILEEDEEEDDYTQEQVYIKREPQFKLRLGALDQDDHDDVPIIRPATNVHKQSIPIIRPATNIKITRGQIDDNVPIIRPATNTNGIYA